MAGTIQETLRDAIASGRLPSGYRLREIPLAEHFACSTTPVREALRQLEREGLAKIHPRRGAEVAGFTLAEVADLYEVRLLLEPYAARRAAEQELSRADLAELRKLVGSHRKAMSEGQQSTPMGASFHHSLTGLAGNAVLAGTVNQVTRQIEAVQARSGALTADPQGQRETVRMHREIMQAIADHDGDAAEQLMRDHLNWAKALVLAAIDGTKH
ncbi:GntR family transcriptional regulator [Microlunatus sp. Y2014]|uniref:GntR family transcriptional regulator n=1 Tax=Microlunatus sp. Y2014 TaxID=3418488 RepID=UPI003DA70AF6